MKLISAMKASRIMESGGGAYLASVMNTKQELPKLQENMIVQDFEDVFPKELIDLPPKHDVYFVIDVIPGTEPISQMPFRMGMAEMKELKVQLRELLDKGFL